MDLKMCLITVEPIVLFFQISFHLNMVTLPQLLLENICVRKYSNATKCALMETGYFQHEYDAIQQQSAMWVSACIGLMAAIVLCTLPTIAAVSDVVGKRKTLFICPISQILQNVLLILIVSTGKDFSTWLLLLPNIVLGAFGSVNGLLVLAFAYVSLITSEAERRIRMTFVEAVCYLGIFAATLSSGLVIERFGYIGTYVLNIILQVLSLMYLMLVLKPVAELNNNVAGSPIEKTFCECSAGKEVEISELVTEKDLLSPNDGLPPIETDKQASLIDIADKEGLVSVGDTQITSEGCKDNEERQKSPLMNKQPSRKQISRVEIKQALNPCANLKATVSALKKLNHRKISISLLIAFFICSVVFFGEASTIVFYLKTKPFYLGAKEVGFYLAYQNVVIGVIGLAFLNWIFQRFFKIRETYLMVVCTVSGIIYQISLGVANSTKMLYSIQILNAMFAMNLPTVRSFISKMADPESVGTVMGALCLAEALSMLTGSLVLPNSYAGLLPFYNGAAFFVLAAILLVTLAITSFCAYQLSKSKKKAEELMQNDFQP